VAPLRPTDQSPMGLAFQHKTLANGLAILAESNADAHTAAVGFFVKTGSRDEPTDLMGVSHFLEHMMFKGTARRTADELNREFDDLGAHNNAFTSQELTLYFAQVLPEALPQTVDLLADMMRPALRDDDFELEKKVILEEIGMYNDYPQWRLQDAMLETHFANHPLSHRVLGTNESIRALTAEQMRGYFEDRYGPDNITVAAAGRLDFDQLVDDLARLTADWRASGASRDGTEPELGDAQTSLTDPKLVRQYLALICPGPSTQDPQRYAARVLADVVGDIEGSRLYWALVDPGVADEASMSYHPMDGLGNLLTFVTCDPDDAETVEAKMMETLAGVADAIQDDEVQRAKNKLATLATVDGETPLGRMRSIATHWIALQEYLPLADQIERYMAVTVDDVRAVAARYNFHPRTIARLGPKVIGTVSCSGALDSR